jgi:6-phosphogluconolactonase (cycloisomerase 2 family)
METKMKHRINQQTTAIARSTIAGARSCLIAALLCGSALAAIADPAYAHDRYLYIESNDHREGKNAIIAYERGEDGKLSLHPGGPFLTGGTGIDNNTNGKLGPNDNDTPIIAGQDGKRLYAVNGHSNSIAVFDIQSDGALAPVPGSPFSSMGIGPVSLAIAGDVLIAANRNEDPAQLDALQGAANSSYASFRINSDGSLKFLSKIESEDGHKATQVLFSRTKPGLAFGNDFQVDADFDGEGAVSHLFSKEQQVRGRLQSFMLTDDGKLIQADRTVLKETADPAPDVPTIPLGIWDHPTKNLIYVGMVTRNQLGVYRYDDNGALSFVSAVANSGQDICWLRVNKAGTRLYAVNNLPRGEADDASSTITVFDISGDNAENPVEISRSEIPLPLGTFVNNRVATQPNSAAFQITLDQQEEFLYVINQRIDQTEANLSKNGNVLHTFSIGESGALTAVSSRHLQDDGVSHRARPQGIVAIDLK